MQRSLAHTIRALPVILLLTVAAIAQQGGGGGGQGGTNIPGPTGSGQCFISTSSGKGNWTWGSCSGSSNLAFSALTSSTNTTAAMVVGSGASLNVSGTGTILATNTQVSAGFAPTTNGVFGVNSTTNLPVFGSNGTTLVWPQTAGPTSNNFITAFSQTTGQFTLAQPAFSNLAGTATTAQLPGTIVYNNQSNTFSTGTQDFSATTQIKLPVAAGYASAANGEIGYDSTNKNWHLWQNGADAIAGIFSGSVTTGDCLKVIVSGGVQTIQDSGGVCNASSLSGMTAGQVPIAASASTVTSSEGLAGAGAGITTGPTSGVVSGDVAEFTGTGGQIADSGAAFSTFSRCNASTAGSLCYWNGSAWTVFAGNSAGTGVFQETASGVPSWNTSSASSLFTSYQFGTQTALTGSGLYLQTTYPSLFSLSQSGSGTSGSPYVDAITIASESANTIFGNWTSGSATPTFNAVASCSGNNNAEQWTSGTGLTCGTNFAQLNLAQTWTATQTFQNIVPSTANTYSLGSSSANWLNLYLDIAQYDTLFMGASGLVSGAANGITGQVLGSTNSANPAYSSPSLVDSTASPVTSSSYLIQCDSSSTIIDRSHSIRLQSGAGTVKIPSSTASGCSGMAVKLIDDNAGSISFVQNSGSSDTYTVVNGATSLDGQTTFSISTGQYVTLSQNASLSWLATISPTSSSLPSGTQGEVLTSTGGTTAVFQPPSIARVADASGWNGASSDIGLVAGTLLSTQCNSGFGAGAVTFKGLTPGTYYANTDPIGYARSTHNNNGCVYKIEWGPGVRVVTSVMWTTGTSDVIDADMPGGGAKTNSGQLESLEPCATSGGCGPNSYPAFSNWNQTTGEEPMVYITGSFTTPSSLSTFQITVPKVPDGTNGSCASVWRGTSKTNSGTNNCANLLTVGGYILFASSSLTTWNSCQSTTCFSAYIANKTGTEPTYTLTLNTELSAFTGLSTSTSYNYIIFQPNITALLWFGGSSGAPNITAEGGKLGKIFLDGEGVAGFVGAYMYGQEATDWQPWCTFDNDQQTGTRASNQGPAAACSIQDKSFVNTSAAIAGSGGFGHSNYHLQNAGVGQGSTFTPVGSVSTNSFNMTNWETDCHIYESYTLTASNASEGPNGDMDIGTCVGTSSQWLNNDFVAETLGHMHVSPSHTEYVARGVWVGPQNLSYGVTVDTFSDANVGSAPTQCGSAPCQEIYLDTNASYGNTIQPGVGTPNSNVDVLTDVSNGCPGTTGSAPCIYNSTSSSSGRVVIGHSMSLPYYQPDSNGTVQGLNVAGISIYGSTSGSVTLAVPATGSAVTATLPSNTGTIAELNLAQTWSALQTFGTNISIGGVTAAGATGTGNVVFSASPTFTGTLTTPLTTAGLVTTTSGGVLGSEGNCTIAQGCTNATSASAGTVPNASSGTASAWTSAVTLGASGTAGTVAMYPSSGNFQGTLGSAATANNTFLLPAAVFTNNHLGYCAVSSTTCTWTDTGYAYNAIPSADISFSFPLTVSGTTNSGGVPYFSNSTTLSTSGILAANGVVLGGGAGVAPATSDLQFSSHQLNDTTNTQALTVSGGMDASANSALGGITLRGANETGAGGSSSAGGGTLMEGGTNAATNTSSQGGSIELLPGASTGSTQGLQGLNIETVVYVKGTTVTQWDLVCESAASTVANCGASPSYVLGVAEVVNSNTVQVITGSQVFITATAAVTVGHTACAGSTAGEVTDSGGTSGCSTGPTWVVMATSGTWTLPDTTSVTATTTLPLLQLQKGGGGGGGSGAASTLIPVAETANHTLTSSDFQSAATTSEEEITFTISSSTSVTATLPSSAPAQVSGQNPCVVLSNSLASAPWSLLLNSNSVTFDGATTTNTQIPPGTSTEVCSNGSAYVHGRSGGVPALSDWGAGQYVNTTSFCNTCSSTAAVVNIVAEYYVPKTSFSHMYMFIPTTDATTSDLYSWAAIDESGHVWCNVTAVALTSANLGTNFWTNSTISACTQGTVNWPGGNLVFLTTGEATTAEYGSGQGGSPIPFSNNQLSATVSGGQIPSTTVTLPSSGQNRNISDAAMVLLQ